MSVESDQVWAPKYGDVGNNLPAVPVLAEPPSDQTPSLPRLAGELGGEARESTQSVNLSDGPTAKDSRGGRQPISYKDELTAAMDELAKDPLVRFVGYGVTNGRAMGTLKNVPESQLIEMPVAENLMVGFAIGLSLKGLKPVVFIERFDFILNALDAIVNHLDKIAEVSHGEFNPTIILRIVVGNRRKPLFTGRTHTQDFSVALRALVSFPVINLMDARTISQQYGIAYMNFPFRSTALVEYKDLI
jgi:Transketolase, pyrimidine binding domain